MTNAECEINEKKLARKVLECFVRWMHPEYDATPAHMALLRLLDMFAHGLIRKMIIQAPPQHGKSQLSSRDLPSFMLGLNPDLKINLIIRRHRRP